MFRKLAKALYSPFTLISQWTSKPQASSPASQAPCYYRAKVGSFEIVALSNGTAARQRDKILSKPELVRTEVGVSHATEPIELSINAYLIDTGSRVVLIDTGAGELFGSKCGLLFRNLNAAGYKAEQVEAILLTHIHADHSGGLTVKRNTAVSCSNGVCGWQRHSIVV